MQRREFLAGLAAIGASALVPDVLTEAQTRQAGTAPPTIGITSLIKRVIVSSSKGAATSAMNVLNPTSRYDAMVSAICSGVPVQNETSSSTRDNGVLLCSRVARRTRSASS